MTDVVITGDIIDIHFYNKNKFPNIHRLVVFYAGCISFAPNSANYPEQCQMLCAITHIRIIVFDWRYVDHTRFAPFRKLTIIELFVREVHSRFLSSWIVGLLKKRRGLNIEVKFVGHWTKSDKRTAAAATLEGIDRCRVL